MGGLIIKVLVLTVFLVQFICANPAVQETGVGSRASALAGNYTALSRDFSALYYNPAGLAFNPVRELHFSFVNSGIKAQTDLNGSPESSSRMRMRISEAGFIRALPTSRGGLSFAFGFSSPYSYDNIRSIEGTDIFTGNNDPAYPNGIELNLSEHKYTYGNQDLWSVGVGWQIAQGLGVGLSMAYLRGTSRTKELVKRSGEKDFIDSIVTVDEDWGGEYFYLSRGFDLRLGIIYEAGDLLRAGFALTLPKRLSFSLEEEVEDFIDGTIYFDEYNGTFRAPATGRGGVALTLPFLTIIGEASFRTPLADAESGSDLSYWKLGFGGGVEIPVSKIRTVFRAGYSWREFELTPFKEEFNGNLISPALPRLTVVDDHNTIGAGLTILLKKLIALEFSYSYSFFKYTSHFSEWEKAITESQVRHRFISALSIRY